jgi:hypothetical protein
MIQRYELNDDKQFDADMKCDPLETLKKLRIAYESNEESHYKNRWRLIERAARMCEQLQKNENDVENFTKCKFWEEKPYKPKTANVLLLCMQYMVGAPNSTSRRYKSAHDYTTAVEMIYEGGYKSTDIFQQLTSRGGPYAIIKSGRKVVSEAANKIDGEANKQPAGNANTIAREGAGSRAVGRSGPASGSVNSSPMNTRRPGASTNATAGETPLPNEQIFNDAEHIAITGGGYQDIILGLEIDETLWILIERVRDQGNIMRFNAVRLQRGRNQSPL